MKTVLILEDDRALALTWQEGFEQNGNRAIIASKATEALELLKAQEVDLVITDMFIYVEDRLVSDGGIKLIGLLRAAGVRTERPDLPIIAITGQPQDSRFMPPVLELAKTMGADLCIEKPISVSSLVEEGQKLMGQSADARPVADGSRLDEA